MSTHLDTYKKWQPFLLGLSAAIGLIAGMNMRQIQKPLVETNSYPLNATDRIQKFADVLGYIQSKYIDSIDLDESTDLALDAWLSTLDPYSDYIPSSEINAFANRMNGTAQDFGLDLIISDTTVYIQHVREVSEAFKVGMESGDQIKRINGMSVHPDMYALDSLIETIFESNQDTVEFEWYSRKQARNHISKIALSTFKDEAVTLSFSPEAGIVYLKIKILNKESYREFMNVLETYVSDKNCKRLIIDLRGNAGGMVHEAAYILNQLIPEKDVLLFKTKGSKTTEKEFKSTGKPFFRLDKIIVLVDAETASAAELIAASLQDLDRAIAIGQNTYGKGTVLEQYSLPDGSAIRLAVSRFITNSGRCIQKPYDNANGYIFLSNPEDSSKAIYYSVKKRKLVSNQGVVPDIEIPDSNPALDSSNHSLSVQIVAEHILELKKLVTKNKESIENNKPLDLILKNGFLKAQANYPGIKWNESQLIQTCHAILQLWIYGEQAYQQQLLKTDLVFLKAISEIKN